jgi:hypothetical protein
LSSAAVEPNVPKPANKQASPVDKITPNFMNRPREVGDRLKKVRATVTLCGSAQEPKHTVPLSMLVYLDAN